MAPTEIGRFILLERIGGGGMGVVYRARDSASGRVVALKLLHPSLAADARAQQRLRREARVVASLVHPNVAGLLGVEETSEGRPVLVMPFYLGRSLEKRLVPLPVEEALDLGVQAARGLAYAHGRGVVHRDVKPANLFVTVQGRLKLLDFGLAEVHTEAAGSGAVDAFGTLEYRSPEAARGQPVDARADVWSLGVTLYELLSGVAPFRARSVAATLLGLQRLDPAPLEHLRADLPAGTGAVIARALARDPDDRYPDAGGLLDDLVRLRRGLAPAAVPAQPASDARASTPARSPAVPGRATRHRLSDRPVLVGRDDELALIATYLCDPDCRLLTLRGMGGAGKTSLALAAAHEQVGFGRFERVAVVPLAALDSVAAIPTAIAAALDIDLERGSHPLRQVVRHLGDAPCLLLFDNYEHLLSGAVPIGDAGDAAGGAAVVAALLERCPRLKVLVTSRVRLALDREWILPLQGLAVPAEGEEPDVERFGALELFVRRARRARPDAPWGRAALDEVARICRRVGGVPLALELAAAWTRSLEPEQIARRLDAGAQLPDDPTASRPRRQRDLRAVFESSWSLLTQSERDALRRLAVFRGGFSEVAAERVAEVPPWRLGDLLDRSLLQRDLEGRYRQHPLLAGFGDEKLAARPRVRARLRARHGRHYLDRLIAQAAGLRGRRQRVTLRSVERDLQNVRAAWRWTLSRVREGASATVGVETRLADAAEVLRIFFEQSSRFEEGERVLREAEESLCAAGLGRSRSVACMRVHRGWLAFMAGRHDDAVELTERALDAASAQDDRCSMFAWNTLGAVRGRTGDYVGSREAFLRALALAETLGDEALAAVCLGNLASIADILGDDRGAEDAYRRSVELSQRLEDHAQTALTLNNQGAFSLRTRGPRAAMQLFRQGLELARSSGTTRLEPIFLTNLGLTAFELGALEEAERHYCDALTAARRRGEHWYEFVMLADLARVWTAQQRFADAEGALERALERAGSLRELPGLLYVLVRLGELRLRQGRSREAARALAAVVGEPAAPRDERDLAERLLAEIDTATLDELPPEPPDPWAWLTRPRVVDAGGQVRGGRTE